MALRKRVAAERCRGRAAGLVELASIRNSSVRADLVRIGLGMMCLRVVWADLLTLGIHLTEAHDQSGVVPVQLPHYEGAEVVVSAPDTQLGNWAGAASCVLVNGTFWLAYRIRRPSDFGRGVGVVVAKSFGWRQLQASL